MSQATYVGVNQTDRVTTISGGLPVVQTFTPVSIDMVSRTSEMIDGMQTNGFDVQQFHNTINDVLRNGTLSGINMGNIQTMMNTLPSEWNTKFTADESGMNDLLNNVNVLMSIAQSSWSTPSSSNTGSLWGSSWSYGNAQPSVHDMIGNASRSSNAGTIKDGMMDHPDMFSVEKVAGLGILGYKSINLGSAGIGLLGDAEAASAAGEAGLGALGLAGETGLGVSALAAGSAIGATEIAAAAVGLAAVGYGIYKMAGGTGSSGLLDKAISGLSSGMDWFTDNIP